MQKTNLPPELYIGLMSGTSLDGIDAGLIDFSKQKANLIAFQYQAFDDDIKNEIKQLSNPDQAIFLTSYGTLDAKLGDLFAETTLKLLNEANISNNEIKAIGCHGQTIHHAPAGSHGFSLQIGDPNRIAHITGITTICDFRRRDIAAGGQGAPLVPAFHQAVFANPHNTTSVINIGGIANISILDGEKILGFDTGPGNTLMDYWCHLNLGQHYDANGEWGRQGKVNQDLLTLFLDDAYFRLSPPKSTGKEYFSFAWLIPKLACYPNCKPEDVQATLCQLSANSITNAILEHAPDSKRILLCGGGIHNLQLVEMLKNNLAMPLLSTAEFGIDPDHVEAIAFAWLAKQTLNNLPGNLCSVTGANIPTILGGIYPGRHGI